MASIILDDKKCVHCRDCMDICPAGVWSLSNKRIVPQDVTSCLGTSCQQCSDSCWKEAIYIED